MLCLIAILFQSHLAKDIHWDVDRGSSFCCFLSYCFGNANKDSYTPCTPWALNPEFQNTFSQLFPWPFRTFDKMQCSPFKPVPFLIMPLYGPPRDHLLRISWVICHFPRNQILSMNCSAAVVVEQMSPMEFSTTSHHFYFPGVDTRWASLFKLVSTKRIVQSILSSRDIIPLPLLRSGHRCSQVK